MGNMRLYLACVFLLVVSCQDFDYDFDTDIDMDSYDDVGTLHSHPPPPGIVVIYIFTFVVLPIMVIAYNIMDGRKLKRTLNMESPQRMDFKRSDFAASYTDNSNTYRYWVYLTFTSQSSRKYTLTGYGSDNVAGFNINGKVNLRTHTITFVKQYNSDEKTHKVDYEGKIDVENNLIEGTWTLSNYAKTKTGSFHMRQFQT